MFVSFTFLIFLAILFITFFVLPKKLRPMLLLLSSYAFCAYIDLRSVFFLIFTSLFTYCMGLFLEKNSRFKKYFLFLSVSFCILLLCILKYSSWLIHHFGLEFSGIDYALKYLIMPVGLSFYIFQAIAYLVDVSKHKLPAEKSFLYLALSLSFFPKLISGPIERNTKLLPQLHTLSSITLKDRGRLSSAVTYLLYGYFMKMVLADRLSISVSVLFEQYMDFDSLFLFLGMLAYTFQIFFDFAGYSNIAIGCALLFGIQLTENFHFPYLATSITDFWRRWHMSLSSFLRDYLYIPLGGNRKGLLRKNGNTILVFLVCGLWHGAGFNYVAWGLLHGFYSVLDGFLDKKKKKRLFTFFEVAFAWIFFRSTSLRSALQYIKCMLTNGFQIHLYESYLELLSLNAAELTILLLGILTLFLLDILCEKKHSTLPALIQKNNRPTRYFIFYILIMIIFIFGSYGPGYHQEQFIYMQF